MAPRLGSRDGSQFGHRCQSEFPGNSRRAIVAHLANNPDGRGKQVQDESEEVENGEPRVRVCSQATFFGISIPFAKASKSLKVRLVCDMPRAPPLQRGKFSSRSSLPSGQRCEKDGSDSLPDVICRSEPQWRAERCTRIEAHCSVRRRLMYMMYTRRREMKERAAITRSQSHRHQRRLLQLCKVNEKWLSGIQ